MSENRTINQHYVPRFYLRNFSPDKSRISVLDRTTAKTFATSVDKVGSENNFFDQPAIEGGVTKIENSVRSIYQSVVNRFEKKPEGLLTFDELTALSWLLSFQALRTKKERVVLKRSLEEGLTKLAQLHLRLKGFSEDRQKDFKIEVDGQKMQAGLLFDGKTIKEFALPFLQEFSWTVCLPQDRSDLFHTSDHPVFTSEGGLHSPGNVILFPLSSKVLLMLEHTVDTPINGILEVTSEEVERFNAAQLHSCYRFVMGQSRNNYSHLIELLNKNEDLRQVNPDRSEIDITPDEE
jgi:hypothetical protein